MKAVKCGCRFLPIRYIKNELPEFDLRNINNIHLEYIYIMRPLVDIFGEALDFANCVNMESKFISICHSHCKCLRGNTIIRISICS